MIEKQKIAAIRDGDTEWIGIDGKNASHPILIVGCLIETVRAMGIDPVERYLSLLHLVMICHHELGGIIPDYIRSLIQMDVKLLQTQGERQSALLDTLCRIVGK